MQLAVLRGQLVGCHVLARGGDVEPVEIGAAEGQRGGLVHRHLDDAVHAPVGRVAHDARGLELRAPHVAFGVDRGAVGKARRRAVRQHARGRRCLVCSGACTARVNGFIFIDPQTSSAL